MSKEKKFDNVNHPERYARGSVECIEAQEAAMIGKPADEAHCAAEVIGYVWRYDMKEPVRSLESAKWYLERLINKVKARMSSDSNQPWLPGFEPKTVKGCSCGLDIADPRKSSTTYTFVLTHGLGASDKDYTKYQRDLMNPRIRPIENAARQSRKRTCDVVLQIRDDLLAVREALLRTNTDVSLELVDTLIDNIENHISEC